MSLVKDLADFSAGKWVTVEDASKALGVKEVYIRSNMVQVEAMADFIVQVRRNYQGPSGRRGPVAYRAINVSNMSLLQIAMLRKKMGFTVAPEMYPLNKEVAEL